MGEGGPLGRRGRGKEDDRGRDRAGEGGVTQHRGTGCAPSRHGASCR